MSKWLSFPLIWLAIVSLWLIGGQCSKWARRYLIAVLMTAYAYFANKEPQKRRAGIVFLAMAGFLSAGYGENSKIKKWCGGSETITRLAMACLIASVFVVYLCLTNGNVWKIPAIYALNMLAWQVRAGSLGKIGKYDILVEDIFRASACAVSLIVV
jgi:hypothetical protein